MNKVASTLGGIVFIAIAFNAEAEGRENTVGTEGTIKIKPVSSCEIRVVGGSEGKLTTMLVSDMCSKKQINNDLELQASYERNITEICDSYRQGCVDVKFMDLEQ